MDLVHFLGRFHPVIVHFPIGILAMAMLFELYGRYTKPDRLNGVVSFTLFLGSMTSLIAIALGWMLASEGNYVGDSLDWHRWFGVSVGVIAIGCWLLKTKKVRVAASGYSVGLTFLGLALLLTGHFGGNLTHGQDYLTRFAPSFIRDVLSNTDIEQGYFNDQPMTPDSVQVFQNLIAPILERHCVQCHSEGEHPGGLNLTSATGLSAGGDHGPVIEPGKPFDSELFVRTTLRRDSERAMPPKGDPLSYNEIRVLEWWIQRKSPFSSNLAELSPPAEVKDLLGKLFSIQFEPGRYLDTLAPTPIADSVFQALVRAGFEVKKVAGPSNLIEVSSSSAIDTISYDQLSALLGARDQLVWLNVENTGITDQGVQVISQLVNLTRLRIQKNPVTDLGVSYITRLNRLQSLNLYETSITNEATESLKVMRALKRVYLWRTGVDSEAAKALRRSRPDLNVDTGFGFEPVKNESDTTAKGKT